MPKRSNGEGNLRRRKDGRYECSIMHGYREDGRRRIITIYGKTQKAVRDKLKALQQDVDNGIDPNANYTFGGWADIWFAAHKDNISATTQQSYSYTLAKLKEAFDRRLLRSIKALDIEQYLKSMRASGFSDSYIAKARAMLMQIFTKAEANGFILKNPVRFAEKMRSSGLHERRDAFTIEEVQQILASAPDDLFGHGTKILFGTGCRLQELLGLEPRHIDPEGASITIEQATQLVKGTVSVGPVKTARSRRIVPVPPALQASARYLREHAGGQYIFEVKKPGSPCDPKYFRNRFKKILSQIPGVRLLTPHSCRHSYISLMSTVTSLEVAASLAGHASKEITEEVYLHVQTPVQIDAVKRFSDKFCVDRHESACT